MDTDTVIWILVAVVAALVILGLLAAWMSKRKAAQRRAQAGELREDARSRTPDLHEADLQAREAQLEADRARLEAQRAEARAAEAEQAKAAEQAGYEDRIREADRLDPAVDTGSSDYQPDTRYPAEPSAEPGTAPKQTGAPTHRAEGPTS